MLQPKLVIQPKRSPSHILTGGLRRRVDSLRGVLERTRGDVTNSIRQQKLQQALADFEQRVVEIRADGEE